MTYVLDTIKDKKVYTKAIVQYLHKMGYDMILLKKKMDKKGYQDFIRYLLSEAALDMFRKSPYYDSVEGFKSISCFTLQFLFLFTIKKYVFKTPTTAKAVYIETVMIVSANVIYTPYITRMMD